MAVKELEIKPFSKKGYKSYKFEEIAFSISERVEPKQTDLEIYVGLEHIDPDSIHIKRHGTPADVEGTKLKVYPGDLIFGKRRAYQRKAAVANFSGICSAHAMVLRANPKVIIPELFPFFIHSDQFMNRAIDISVGSLSPTINWGTLKTQEFVLPPIEQQAKLAELLWASDKTIEKQTALYKSYQKLFERYLNEATQGELSNFKKNWKEFVLGNLGESYGGLTGKTKEDFGRGAPFITYMNIFKNSKIDINNFELFDLKPNENQNEIKYGDIFFTGSSETPEEVGMSSVLLDDVKGYYLNSFCFGFRLNDFETLRPDYARYLFRSKHVRDFMHLHAQGSTRFNLSKTTVKNKLKLVLPEVKEQELIAKDIESKELSLIQFEKQIRLTKQIQKQLINQIFG